MKNTLLPFNIATGVTSMGMSHRSPFGFALARPDDNGGGGGGGNNDASGANNSGGGGGNDGGGASNNNSGGGGGNDGGNSGKNTNGGGEEPKAYTPAQINAIVEDRLARDRQQRGVSDFETYKASHQELQQLKDKDLPEADRLRGQLAEKETAAAEATARANAASLTALRYEVAAAKNVDLSLAPRLQGATKEELEADADKLLTAIGTTAGAGPRSPRPNQQQGHSSGENGEKSVSAGAALYAAAHGKKTSTTQ